MKGVSIKPTYFKSPNYLALSSLTPLWSYLHSNAWSEASTQYLRSFSIRKVTTTLIPDGYLHIAKTINHDAVLVWLFLPIPPQGQHPCVPTSVSSTSPKTGCQGAFLIQSSNWETPHSTCIPLSHTDLNELLGVLVKFLQDGKGLLRKTVLKDPLDHTAAIWMCRQGKNLRSTRTGKHRQQGCC